MTKEVIWNGVSSTAIPELTIGVVTRRMVGDIRGSYVSVPGREGAWFFPEKRGLREIRLECFVEGDTFPTDRRDAITAIADWLDVEVEASLVISDEPGVYYEATLSEPVTPEEWREFGVFEIAFLAQPYSLDLDTSSHSTTGDNDFIETWNPQLEVPVYPVITITPNNGTITEFDLEFNGETLHFEGLIPDDQTITINSISAAVTSGANIDTELTGAYDPDDLVMGGVSGKFPLMIPPSNNSYHFIRQGGTATSITIVVSYRKRYRK